jgi:hypothetical protein
MQYFWKWGKPNKDNENININDEILSEFIPLIHYEEENISDTTVDYTTSLYDLNKNNENVLINIDTDLEFIFEVRKGLRELMTWNDFDISPNDFYDISLRNRKTEDEINKDNEVKPIKTDIKYTSNDNVSKMIYVIVGSSIGAIISVPVIITSLPIMISITTLGGLCGYLFSL